MMKSVPQDSTSEIPKEPRGAKKLMLNFQKDWKLVQRGVCCAFLPKKRWSLDSLGDFGGTRCKYIGTSWGISDNRGTSRDI